MENNNGLWEMFHEKGIDFDKLPHDCPAVAAERMRRDYCEKGTFNPEDVYIVLGDPSRGISFPTNEEEARKMLEEAASRKDRCRY